MFWVLKIKIFKVLFSVKRLVIGRGSVFADLLVIGEAPGAQEDLEGKPYVGKSGKLLNELLIQAGIDYKKDVYFCNVVFVIREWTFRVTKMLIESFKGQSSDFDMVQYSCGILI